MDAIFTQLANIELPVDASNEVEKGLRQFAVLSRDEHSNLVISTAWFCGADNAWIKDDKGNVHSVKSVMKIVGSISEAHKNHVTRVVDGIINDRDTAERLVDEAWPHVLQRCLINPVVVRNASKAFKTDYLAAADEFLAAQPLWFDQNENWWVYDANSCCWRSIDETSIMNAIDDVLALDGSTSGDVQGQILRALQRRSRRVAPKTVPETWVQFHDTFVDIATLNRHQAGSDWFCTNPIPWEIGCKTDTPVLDKLFVDWVGEEEALLLFEVIAFCCIPKYFIHRIFALIGNGSNGKTTFQNVIRSFVGSNNCCRAELDHFAVNKFESSKLYKKLVCVIGETNFEDIRNTSMMKSLTSDDLMSIEFKNKNPFTFVNYAKIIVATNTLPISHDTTDGFYRRWQIIEFNKQYGEKRDVMSEITDDEYKCLAAKLVSIMHRLWKEREFTNQGTIQDRRDRYEAKSNPLALFVKDKCVRDANSEIFAFEFRDAFATFCQERGLRAWSDTSLGRWMREHGYDRVRMTSDNGKLYWAYAGLKFLPARGAGQMTVTSALENSARPSNPGCLLASTQNPYEEKQLEANRQPGQPRQFSCKDELFSLLKINKPLLTDFASAIFPSLSAKGFSADEIDRTLQTALANGDVMEVERSKFALVE